MLGPGPGLGGVVTHIWLIIAIYEPGGPGQCTCPGGPGPVLVSASDHQHLTPGTRSRSWVSECIWLLNDKISEECFNAGFLQQSTSTCYDGDMVNHKIMQDWRSDIFNQNTLHVRAWSKRGNLTSLRHFRTSERGQSPLIFKTGIYTSAWYSDFQSIKITMSLIPSRDKVIIY